MNNGLRMILIVGIVINLNILHAQAYVHQITNIDSLKNYIYQIGQDYHEFAETIDGFDEMSKQGTLSNQHYGIIARCILENGITEGYNFILDNALNFKSNHNMKPIHIMTGESPVIYKVLKSISMDKVQLLIHHILYSDYLSRELAHDQLEMLSAIVRMDGFSQFHDVMNDSTRVLNLESMIK